MSKPVGQEHIAPWEKAFDSLLSPLEEFIHRQTTSGILLMLCAVIALVIANTPLLDEYRHILHSTMTIGFENFNLSKSLHHWINDGLMAIFFLVVGLELKREILVGELADPKAAMMPIIAAIGGMVMPALIYVAVNPSGDAMNGWGIPMATDIAFALGALALLGRRVPASLLTFLVALAIVDDLGAVIVIALFYTETLNITALAVAGGLILVLISLNRGGIRGLGPYLFVGVFLWIAMLKSGVHATLAGVILAFIVPMKPKYDPKRFMAQILEKAQEIRQAYKREENILRNEELRSRVQALSDGVTLVQAPAQVLEHKLHLPSAYLVIPIFALANAGIPIEWSQFGSTLTHPVALGIILGLTLGKLIGIAGFVWLSVKLGFGRLPQGLNFKHIIGVGMMGGIGFTMSIFIAELGFAHLPQDLLMAKTGVLFASLTAGIGGFIFLYFVGGKNPPEQPAGDVETSHHSSH